MNTTDLALLIQLGLVRAVATSESGATEYEITGNGRILAGIAPLETPLESTQQWREGKAVAMAKQATVLRRIK